MIRFQLIFYALINLLCDLYAQNNSELIKNYTHQDTLRGSITSERSWWDLTYYDLELSIDPKTKTIYGHNTRQYTILLISKTHKKFNKQVILPTCFKL